MRTKLDELRKPAVNENPEKTEKDTLFSFDVPASKPPTYPGLDGHPRRITPIPISVAMSEPAVGVMKSPDQIRQETAELIQRLR